MREIKFRAWDKAHKKMMWVDDGQDFAWLGENALKAPTRYEVMQFTNLKDKNREEIYEGDVLKVTSISVENYVGEVRFIRGSFCVQGEKEGHQLFVPLKLEVIGNIYENPDLLKS